MERWKEKVGLVVAQAISLRTLKRENQRAYDGELWVEERERKWDHRWHSKAYAVVVMKGRVG